MWAQTQDGAPKYILLGLGLALVQGNNWVTDRRRKKDSETLQKLRAQDDVTRLLTDAVSVLESCSATGEDGRFRAAVYLPDDDKMVMAYFTAGFSALEEELRWAHAQGAVGQAWTTNKTIVAPSPEKPDIVKDWGMTKEQKNAAQAVKMVVATPLHAGDAPKCTAVLTIDDTALPGPMEPIIKATTQKLGTRVAKLLEEVEFNFPV